jgi:outer membrane protein assembly factor BamA
MFDLEVDIPRLKNTRGDIRFYAKYENSPLMDYYGPGPDSQKGDRTSYLLEDTGLDVKGRFRLWKDLYIGGSAGLYLPNTGRGKRKGVPSTEDKFSPEVTPGLGDQPNFFRAGGILQYDYRDLPTGPRTGGNYYAEYTRYWDRELDRHNFHLLDAAVEQYIPYWNMTNVLALRLAAVMAWSEPGNTVPFYMQPTLGGNEYLRGFARYRFHDQNAVLASIEHRWHLFSGGHAALFFETGKVAPRIRELKFSNLQYIGGLGFRFTIRNAVIMRIDNAVSREGYRFIWTFSNMW